MDYLPIPETLIIDGVEYKLPQYIEKNYSIFIPCLDHERIFEIVKHHYISYKWCLKWTPYIENSYSGIRIWRIK